MVQILGYYSAQDDTDMREPEDYCGYDVGLFGFGYYGGQLGHLVRHRRRPDVVDRANPISLGDSIGRRTEQERQDRQSYA